MTSDYKVVLVVRNADFAVATHVQSGLYELAETVNALDLTDDGHPPKLEIERFSPMRTREPTDGKS